MLGLLSDAHGHLGGFTKGLALLRRHGARRFLFLGDAVGYIPSWDVLAALYEERAQFDFVLGNHEEMLLSGAAENDDVYQLERLRLVDRPELRSFVARWPRLLSLDLPCGSALFVHGSPANTQNGYLYPDTSLDGIGVDHDFVFCGHTHRPFVRSAGGTAVVNIGSCGLPRDDGRYGSVALFDETSGEVRILRYDLEAEAAQLVGRFPGLHPAVIRNFARRSDELVGEMDV